MTWPNVTVSQKNRYNGTTNDIERVVLYVGYGDANTDKTQAVNTESWKTTSRVMPTSLSAERLTRKLQALKKALPQRSS